MSEIQYEWNFSPLEITYHSGSMQDIINVVHWQMYATYPLETGSITKGSIGTIGFESPDPDNFIPFADVTKEIVTTWVEGKMGEEQVNNMKTGLSASIAYDLHPTRGVVSPPWIDPNPPMPSESVEPEVIEETETPDPEVTEEPETPTEP
jgi:hypothetical protein